MFVTQIKHLVKTILTYIAITLIALTLLSVAAHWNFLRGSVYIYYYRMLYYAVIVHAVMLAAYVLCQLARKSPPPPSSFITFISGVIISALFCAFFITAGPMPLDRSYSIYSVAEMYEHADKIYTREEVESAFYEGYILKNGATYRRIQEQMSIGNFEQVSENQYRITNKGRRLIEMMRFVEKLYPVDEKRTLYPSD